MTDQELVRRLRKRMQDIMLSSVGLVSKEARDQYGLAKGLADRLNDPTTLPKQRDEARALAKRLLGIQTP